MIENIPLPRLLNASGGTERRITPISVSIDLEITPLSSASMILPQGESIPARGYVELYTCMGSAGVFRVRSPQDAYGEDMTTAELEHAVVEVGDYLVLEDYSEMMAATSAMQTVFSHYKGSKWQLGSIAALGSVQIALEANHNRVLEAMLAIMDQRPSCMMTFDFSTTPWTINIVAKGGAVSAEGRLSRNLNYARVTYDDTELCTRAWYEYAIETEDGPSSEWAYVDADTISTYGLIEREVRTGSDYTQEEALRAATAYITKHKNPRVTIETSIDELSVITGEEFDTFTIGKMCRLALADYGVTIQRHITGLSFTDVYGNPRSVNARLAEEEDTAITFLHDLDTKGGSGGGGGGGRKIDDVWKEFRTRFYQDDRNIGLTAERVDHANAVLEAAGIDVSVETGVLIYDYDVENGIGSKLNVTKDEIRSEVNANNSLIYSEVIQTANEIRSQVNNALSDFYTAIIQTASEIIIRTGDNTKTFHQRTAPTGTEEEPLVDGDVWFDSIGQFTWGDVAEKTWIEDTAFDWGEVAANSIYRYDGTREQWVMVQNERALMQDTRFEQSKELIYAVAARVDVVDGLVHEYRTESRVEADGIRQNMRDSFNQLSASINATAAGLKIDYIDRINGTESHISQTASQIRLEVRNTVSDLQSSITQTADQIRAEVSNSVSGLQSSITQTANQIRAEVSNTSSGLYSMIRQNADAITLRVMKNGVISAINQTAEQIQISAGKINLSGYVTTSMLESAFQDIGQIVVDQMTIDDYFTCLGYNTTWKSKSIRNVSLSTQRPFMYGSTSGASGTVSGYVVIDYSDSTIYYLGR